LAGPAGINDSKALQIFVERLKAAMVKSMREAKERSNWVEPNADYEQAVLSFVDASLDTSGSDAFYSLFLPFADRIARLGVQNSLVQAALKLTVPGVPDTYEGCELWNLSMVDPDNRRPVDYERRVCLLERIEHIPPREMLRCWRDGAIKLLITQKLLQLRRADAELFARGEYEPLLASGPKSDRICGFVRRLNGTAIAVLTALFPARREADPDWAGTMIALPIKSAASLAEQITGAELSVNDSAIPAAAAFRELPVSVLRLS
jgi:(1->4)-alpha-D-glucan 1-alpha-D-glucosylmutase